MRFKQKCVNRLESRGKSRITRGICQNPDHKMSMKQVNMRVCSQCFPNDQEVKYSRVIENPDAVERRDVGVFHEMPLTQMPSQRPQKGPGEPPTITPDGTLIYVKKGWEPPPCPPGYQRKSNDLDSHDAWVLEPKKPLCKHLDLTLGKKAACGCLRVIPTCVYTEPKLVGFKTCRECDRKEPRDVQTP